MMCDICGKREAVIHIQQIIGKETIDLNICSTCAGEKKISGPGESLNLAIVNVVRNLLENRKLIQSEENTLTKCSVCGTELTEIINLGKTGCPNCYRQFREEIRKTFSQSDDPVLHKGFIPSKLKTYRNILVDQQRLRRELDEAVATEDYETAVILRDRLKKIETEIE